MQEKGITTRLIAECPIAIVDLETTGLTPGADRVVEVSVVRLDPGQSPRLALDTLVNPMRPVAATEIHGITEDDVLDAPRFNEIVGELVDVLSGCVLAAYNVYFDVRFLEYELMNVGLKMIPPHLCLMYMRPMFGLGSRCRLDEACRAYGIEYQTQHVAAHDAQASSRLMEHYIQVMKERGISTFYDLAQLKQYRFVESFRNDPLPGALAFNLCGCERLRSRVSRIPEVAIDKDRQALGEYWDALTTVLDDLQITDDELEYMLNERSRLGLSKEQIRVLHARAFANAIAQFADDQWLDDDEMGKLRRLRRCLSQLGWAPGE